MRPVDDGLHRTTVVHGQLEPQEEQRLTEVFGEPEQDSERSLMTVNNENTRMVLTYTGEVRGDAWADGLGGLGSWSEVISPLGSATIFMESFGGDARVAEDLVALLHLLDVIEASIQERLTETMEDDPLLPTMQSVLHNRVLPDAKDLLLMLWGQAYQPSDASSDTNDASVDQWTTLYMSFLWQRGWITSDEAAMLLNTGKDMSAGMGKFFEDRCFARALDLDIGSADDKQKFDQLKEQFSVVFDESFWDSIKKKVDAEFGDRIRLLTSIALRSPKVTATLEAKTPPTLTNGTWDEVHKRVIFKLDKPPLAVGFITPPVNWRAIWVEPNATTQNELFGQVIVTGEHLIAFCLGWQNATKSAREEVQEFLGAVGSDSIASKEIIIECLRIIFSQHVDTGSNKNSEHGGEVWALRSFQTKLS